MSAREIAFIVFASVFGSTMFGFVLGKILPDRHLDSESKDIVKLATGLTATLSALALGLLVSSAKDTFDQANHQVMQLAVNSVMLDRVLAQYGPETMEFREVVKSSYSVATEQLLSGDESQQAKLNTPEGLARLENIQSKLRTLSPQNDAQRQLQSQALQLSAEVAVSRWRLLMQKEGTISKPLLVVMVSWLCTIFAAWGVFSPRNLVVAGALFVSALSVSGATLLILELDRPLTGWIRVSSVPVQEAISHLGE